LYIVYLIKCGNKIFILAQQYKMKG